MNNKDLNVAQHMVAHCERIERYLNRCNNSLDEFMNDELIQDGVTMQLLAMGELTTHFSEKFKLEHPTEIDWRNFKQLRNYSFISLSAFSSLNCSSVRYLKRPCEYPPAWRKFDCSKPFTIDIIIVNSAVNIIVVRNMEITAMIFFDFDAFRLLKLRRRIHFLLATFISITDPVYNLTVFDTYYSVCKLSDFLFVCYHHNCLGEFLACYL